MSDISETDIAMCSRMFAENTYKTQGWKKVRFNENLHFCERCLRAVDRKLNERQKDVETRREKAKKASKDAEAIRGRTKKASKEMEAMEARTVVNCGNAERKEDEALKAAFFEGAMAALELYAHWKDGVTYVGSCGTTLRKAKETIESDLEYAFKAKKRRIEQIGQ